MVIGKKEFRSYSDDDLEQTKKPISVKLNDKDDEMLKIAMFALNLHSKSGVLKRLAHYGFQKVILDGLGVEEFHYLTRSDRTKVIHDKPTSTYYDWKGR